MGILKVYILAILTGFVTGLITIPYRWMIEKSAYIRDMIFNLNNPLYYLILGFIGIYVIGILISKMVEDSPLITGSGIPQARAQIYGRIKVKNPIKNLVFKFLGGVSGISAGYSLGREGPSVQMGALIGETISQVFKVDRVERKYLIMSGAGAGLSSAFTAPLASAIFIAEELQKYFNSRLTIFSFLGSIVSGYMAAKFFVKNDYLDIVVNYPQNLNYFEYFYICIAFAIFISLVGKSFSFLLIYFQKLNRKIKISKYIKIFFYTLMVIVIGIFYKDLTAGGESFLIREGMINDLSIGALIFFIILKLLFTTLSYSTGFPGGIFLPLLVIGGLSGKLFGLILLYFNLIDINNLGVFIFLGMASAFVVVVRSPATGIILILEMTWDFTLLPSMVIVAGLAYTVSNLLKVEPIYDLLYKPLIENDDNDEVVELVFEVGSESYLIGEEIGKLELPGDLKIKSIERKGEFIKTNDTTEIEKNDIIGIPTKKRDIEKFYDSLRSLAQEN